MSYLLVHWVELLVAHVLLAALDGEGVGVGGQVPAAHHQPSLLKVQAGLRNTPDKYFFLAYLYIFAHSNKQKNN